MPGGASLMTNVLFSRSNRNSSKVGLKTCFETRGRTAGKPSWLILYATLTFGDDCFSNIFTPTDVILILEFWSASRIFRMLSLTKYRRFGLLPRGVLVIKFLLMS